MPAITKVCARCGSDDIKIDAWAEWDVENQCWELGPVFEKPAICEPCGGETTIVDREVAATPIISRTRAGQPRAAFGLPAQERAG